MPVIIDKTLLRQSGIDYAAHLAVGICREEYDENDERITEILMTRMDLTAEEARRYVNGR